jgi:hypothetical protein
MLSSMRCPGCKREINEGASVCRLCGYVVDPSLRDDDGSAAAAAAARTRRSGFTQVREAPKGARPVVPTVVPTGVRRPGDAPGGFVDVAPTDVAINISLSTSDGNFEDDDELDHAEKTVTSAPPQMSAAAVAAPAPSLADIEDLLEGETVRAPQAASRPAVDDDADTVVRGPRVATNASVPWPPRPATSSATAPKSDDDDAFAGERTDIIGVRPQPPGIPVDDEKTQVNATEPHPPAPRNRRG